MSSDVCTHEWSNTTISKPVAGLYWEICFKCGRVRKIRLTSKVKYRR